MEDLLAEDIRVPAVLREFPQHREGFRRLNTWWWQGIQDEPRYATLVRGG